MRHGIPDTVYFSPESFTIVLDHFYFSDCRLSLFVFRVGHLQPWICMNVNFRLPLQVIVKVDSC